MRAYRLIAVFGLVMLTSTLLAQAAPNTVDPAAPAKPGSITPNNPASTQLPPVDGQVLQKILNSKDYLEHLVRYLIGYETWIGICTDAEPDQRLRTLMITEPVRLPGIDGISTPQWLEVIQIKGCNRSYERMIYATYHDGKPVFHAQISGSTKTTPQLQHETLAALRARETERAHQAGCERADSARILAANLDPDWAGGTDREWREIWVVHSCKGVKKVPVLFGPGADGTVTFSFDAG